MCVYEYACVCVCEYTGVFTKLMEGFNGYAWVRAKEDSAFRPSYGRVL